MRTFFKKSDSGGVDEHEIPNKHSVVCIIQHIC